MNTKIQKKDSAKFKDKWLKKKWISIKAPDFLGGQIIGHCVYSKEKSLVGRNMVISFGQLTKNPKDHNILIKLKITDILEGNLCTTKYNGQELNKNQIAMCVRRDSSRIDNIEILKLNDVKLRIKTISFSRKRVPTSIRHLIREKVKEDLEKYAVSNNKLPSFLQDINSRKMQKQFSKNLKNIYPCRDFIVRKIEICK